MKLFTLVAAATLITTPVLAADAIVYNEPAPVAVDTFSWTGGYIGVNAGYAWGKLPTNIDVYTPNNQIFSSTEYKQSHGGFIGGVQAGYNWQFDKAVFGLETDIQGTTLKETSILLDNNNASLETKINWLGTTRVRLGYLPTERLLAYVTGGVAYGGVEASLSDYKGQNTSSSKTKAGYAVGAGLEYAFANNWTAKVEYLHVDLGKISHEIYRANPTDVIHDDATHKFRTDTLRIGVNYKF